MKQKEKSYTLFNTPTGINSILDDLNLLAVILDQDGKILYVNDSLCTKTGYKRSELLEKSWVDIFIQNDLQTEISDVLSHVIYDDSKKHHTNPISTKEKKILTISWNNSYVEDPWNSSKIVVCIGEDITNRLSDEYALKRQLKELKILNGIALATTRSLSLDQLFNETTKLLEEIFPINNYGFYLVDENKEKLTMHESYQGVSEVRLFDRFVPLHEGILGYVFRTGKSYVSNDVNNDEIYVCLDKKTKSELAVPIKINGDTIGVLNTESDSLQAYTKEDEDLLNTFSQQLSIAIEKIKLFESSQRQAKELSSLYEIAIATSSILKTEKLLYTIQDKIKALFPIDTFLIVKTVNNSEEFEILSAIEQDEILQEWEGRRFPSNEGGLIGYLINNQKPLLFSDLENEEPPIALIHGKRPAKSWLGVPLVIRGEIRGAISVQSFATHAFNINHQHLLESLASQIAITLENASLLEQTQSHLEKLSALHDIDLAINSSLDLRVTLNILLDQIVEKLKVDAAAVLLLNSRTKFLNYAAGRGFRSRMIESYQLRLGDSITSRLTMEKHLMQALNLSQEGEETAYLPLLQEENFSSFYSVPLIAKGQVKGVLDIFNRSPLVIDQEWIYFLETLAGQAAIAIDNTQLLEDLQKSNIELTRAYDSTLEGWSRALDLRDQETEGHTQRVVKMTIRMARILGVPDDELIHIQRGALLHDIGKMGIPDRILLKNGPLSEKEWVTMRKHPIFAHDLIHPIAHLRPAIDIPYCHHEKWDGSGYPQGLSKGEIPLSARIFSVIDVWDALTSDRPYRKAWDLKKTLKYIEDQKNKHFDPEIVDLFLKLIKSEIFKKL